MRHKRLKFSALFLLGLTLTGIHAQTMYVKESNGSQSMYALSNIQKISFTMGNLNIVKTDNTSGEYSLNGLRNLSFSDASTDLNKPLLIQSQLITAYPNPATLVLNINLSEVSDSEGTISIVSLKGKTILMQPITNERIVSLDISHLPKGIYLCRYSTTEEIRTVKIIKQ